ncbi:MAG TPA: cysteine hydrolase [Streptosporangiaceae bacterium]|nr:cysteine hydrolase [Streptosporangiaceae bacterium]
MLLDPKHTAIVLVEYQNDFTSDGGALHDAVRDVMESTGMLENTLRLVQAARAAGAMIVHAPIEYVTGYRELALHPYGILKGVVDATAFVKGEWGAQIVDALAPQEDDVILEGKRGLDSFATTNLDFILRGRGITTIALCGFLTNCCVESTMRTGYEKGYHVITLSDCVAAMSAEEHENALKFDYPMFSEVMTARDFTEQLERAATAAR